MLVMILVIPCWATPVPFISKSDTFLKKPKNKASMVGRWYVYNWCGTKINIEFGKNGLCTSHDQWGEWNGTWNIVNLRHGRLMLAIEESRRFDPVTIQWTAVLDPSFEDEMIGLVWFPTRFGGNFKAVRRSK